MNDSLLADLVSSDHGKEVHDEELLNILRETDRMVMGTQDIADEVDIGREAVRGRLSDLEDESRVRSTQIGRPWIWDLHPDERQEVVPPKIDRLVHAFGYIRDVFTVTRKLGMYLLMTGMVLIIAGLTAALPSAPVASVSGVLVVIGYYVVAVGGTTWAVGGGVHYATIIIERALQWRLERDAQPTQPNNRGQIDARLLIGLIALVLVGGPVIGAAVKMQSGFAASPVFSWPVATILAALFVLMLVFAILGID